MSLMFAALFVVSAAAVLVVPVMAEGSGDPNGPAYNATNVTWPETVEGVVDTPSTPNTSSRAGSSTGSPSRASLT